MQERLKIEILELFVQSVASCVRFFQMWMNVGPSWFCVMLTQTVWTTLVHTPAAAEQALGMSPIWDPGEPPAWKRSQQVRLLWPTAQPCLKFLNHNCSFYQFTWLEQSLISPQGNPSYYSGFGSKGLPDEGISLLSEIHHQNFIMNLK